MSQPNQERKGWIRKGPSEKTRSESSMRNLSRTRMTKSSWPKNKKCKFKKPKIDRQLKNHVISIKSSSMISCNKIIDWENNWPNPVIVPSVQRKSFPKQKIPQIQAWLISPTISIWSRSYKIRKTRNLRNFNHHSSEWTIIKTVLHWKCFSLFRWLCWVSSWWEEAIKGPQLKE